ncbi:MAG: hypothetical protein ABWK00_03630 [Desulfurococcaceae archaeon]
MQPRGRPRLVDGRLAGRPEEELTPEEAVAIGSRLGTALGSGSVLVSGRDMSFASRMLKRAMTAGLMAVGTDVLDFHESTAGEIAFSMKRFGAAGGFMFVTSPFAEGELMLKIFRAPGAELVGDELASTLSTEPRRAEARRVGWVTFAEYMHKIYASALISFVRHDLISGRRLSIVVSASRGPSSLILHEVLPALGIDGVVVSAGYSGSVGPRYPMAEEVIRVHKVAEAAGADVGAVVSTDGSELALLLGGRLLTAEETFAAILRKASRGARVAVQRGFMPQFAKVAEDLGVSLLLAGDERELLSALRTRRASRVAHWRGRYACTTFSYGYDALLALLEVLEVLAERGGDALARDAEAVRSLMALGPRRLEPEEASGLCRAWGECHPQIGGYRLFRNGEPLAVLVVEPGTGSYEVLARDSQALSDVASLLGHVF